MAAAFAGFDLATGCAAVGVEAGFGTGAATGVGGGGGVGCCVLSSSIFCRIASRARAIFSESALGGRGASVLGPDSAWAIRVGVCCFGFGAGPFEGVAAGVATAAVAAAGAVVATGTVALGV